MKKLLLIFFLISFSLELSANETKVVKEEDFKNKTVTVDLNGYKILKFSKTISKIQFDTSDFIEADFLRDTNIPLSTLKVKGKKIGKQSAIVTFHDKSVISVKFNIVKNMNDIIYLVNKLYPDIEVSQINDTVILQGHVINQTQKSKLIEIFGKYGIDTDKQLIDLIKDNYSTKMVRVKLYVVQIDNNHGQQIINDWTATGIDIGDATIDSIEVSPNITSLSGGITAIASYAGSNFNLGLTLNYLKRNNAARIVNESTLIMKENEEAKFNTGGKFFIKSSTTTAEGVPSTELKEIEYGLNITMKAKKIIENQYIDFEAMAKSDDVDYDNTVDDIPGLVGNEVTTNVLIENGSTIVLAGILKADYSQYKEKVPGLGDIPILGQLFTSTDTKDENYDLVFFMTPEIIDPMKYNQKKMLQNKLDTVKNKDYNKQKSSLSSNKEVKKKLEENRIDEKTLSRKEELTNEEKHKLRVKQIFGL